MTTSSAKSSVPRTRKSAFLSRLVVSIIFLNALVIVMVGLSINKSRHLYEDRAEVSTQNLAKLLSDSIGGVLDKIDITLHTVESEAERQLAGGGLNKQELDQFIQHIYSFVPELESLRIADAQGAVILGIGVVKNVNITDRDYFIKLRDDPKVMLAIAQPVVSRMSGKWVVNIARRLNKPDGSFAGVVFAQLTLDYFTGMFSKIDNGKNGSVALRDSELQLITRYPVPKDPGSTIGRKLISQELEAVFASNREAGTYFTPRSAIDNLPRTLSYRKISNYPLYIVVGRATRDYLEDWKSDLLLSLALAAAFIAATLTLAWALYGRWHKQILLTEELLRSKVDLEFRVAERTAELMKANESLSEEAAERQVAQEKLALKHRQLEQLNCALEERIRSSVDELRQKDHLLVSQNRLAAMGEMISNIAHQWRQPLNNIGLIVQGLQIEHPDGVIDSAELEDSVDKCMKIIKYMSQTIDDFRSFFKPDKEKSVFSIYDAIHRAIAIIRVSIENRNITLNVIDEGAGTITGYANEYSQVVWNIVNNAKDILTERCPDGGRIEIRCVRSGAKSVVTVLDNGGGIDADVLPKIFDPYFTTKHQSMGTGVGLYMSKIIIEQHMSGRLTASNVEDGAEFKIEV